MLAFNLRHALLLTSLVFAANSYSASFDCAGASTPVEKAVCADPNISGLDEKLGELWTTTLTKVADPKTPQVANINLRTSLTGSDTTPLSTSRVMVSAALS